MKESFITKIKVNNSRNIEDLEIPLSEDHRQHLILTGKNGSGKTSLLLELNKFFQQIENGGIQSLQQHEKTLKQLHQNLLTQKDEKQISQTKKQIGDYENALKEYGGTRINFTNEYLELFQKAQKGEFLLAFFDSKRLTNLQVPTGINKINLQKKYNLNQKANTQFIQYIVNLKADRSFARDDNEMDVVTKIDDWFLRLEKRLQSIFDSASLALVFNRKTYNFDIIIDGLEPFSFNNLSDGYSAIISIVTELILRMEAHNVKSYDLEGVVIIDEIETHLHVDLQKKILPFLTDFFPKLQFIVTTHSPFILSSLSNATICDLETKTITTDLSNYSYDALIESYFKADKYSDEIKVKIIEFDRLTSMTKRSPEENDELRQLRNYFAHAPKYLSKELLVRLQQIKLNELNKKDS
jgi:predicted ATP-binding protein involved in virulence